MFSSSPLMRPVQLRVIYTDGSTRRQPRTPNRIDGRVHQRRSHQAAGLTKSGSIEPSRPLWRAPRIASSGPEGGVYETSRTAPKQPPDRQPTSPAISKEGIEEIRGKELLQHGDEKEDLKEAQQEGARPVHRGFQRVKSHGQTERDRDRGKNAKLIAACLRTSREIRKEYPSSGTTRTNVQHQEAIVIKKTGQENPGLPAHSKFPLI